MGARKEQELELYNQIEANLVSDLIGLDMEIEAMRNQGIRPTAAYNERYKVVRELERLERKIERLEKELIMENP